MEVVIGQSGSSRPLGVLAAGSEAGEDISAASATTTCRRRCFVHVVFSPRPPEVMA